jgi:ferredoxin
VSQFKVTLQTPAGDYLLDCSSELSILDTAARHGLVLPAVCRGGACSACIGSLISGVAPDQDEQTYLTEPDLAAGFVLLCVAFARGDCTLKTHQTYAFLEQIEDN